jgi:hypothetical protein
MKFELCSLARKKHLEKLISLKRKRGYWHSKETKKKMSIAKIGYVPANKGVPHTEATKNKISEANKGKLKGRRFSEAHKRNISIGRQKWWVDNPHMKEIWSQKQTGSLGSNWQGGKTVESQTVRGSLKYRAWRNSVLQRDRYLCQICGLKGGWSKELKKRVILHADHIQPFSLFADLRFDLTNGRTLCLECHRLTPTWGGLTRFKIKENV